MGVKTPVPLTEPAFALRAVLASALAEVVL
jgi:hypothetical protein